MTQAPFVYRVLDLANVKIREPFVPHNIDLSFQFLNFFFSEPLIM